MRLVLSAAALLCTGIGVHLLLTAVAPPADAATGLPSTFEIAAEVNEGPLASSVGTARTPVQKRIEEETYPVYGGTAAELLRSLQRSGPRTGGEAFFGLTRASMDLRYDTVDLGHGCELRDVRVRLDLTVTLPTWTTPRSGSGDLDRAWGQFLSALRRHESEHVRVAEQGAEALYRAVEGVRRPSCAEAEAEGRRRVDRLQIEIEAAHRQFDERTGHGRTEGAVWPRP